MRAVLSKCRHFGGKADGGNLGVGNTACVPFDINEFRGQRINFTLDKTILINKIK